MTILLVEAGPGTGKTTTLEVDYNYLLTGRFGIQPTKEQALICYKSKSSFGDIPASQIVFISFNTSIRDRLRGTIPKSTGVYTFGGLGLSCLIKRHGHHQRDDYRGQKLLSALLGKEFSDLSSSDRSHAYTLLKYVEHFKEELLYPSAEAFHAVQEKYGMPDPPGGFCDLAAPLLQQMQVPNGTWEFIDQVWLGLQTLTSPLFQLAIIDEGQDLSVLRMEFAIKVAHHQLICGDPFQSVNAFAGADHTAFEKLRQVATATLPLKTSFRLPPNHATYANTIRPANIVPFKETPGPIEIFPLNHRKSPALHNPSLSQKISDFLDGHYYNPQTDICDTVMPVHHDSVPHANPWQNTTNSGDYTLIPVPASARNPEQHLIIGRTNAEIFRVALNLLHNGVKARIVRRTEDQDILKNLTKYIEYKTNYFKKARKPYTISNLIPLLKKDKASAQARPYRQGIVLYEKANCLLELCNQILASDDSQSQSQSPSSPVPIHKLNNLLTNLCAESDDAVRCCTIHKAKGLEADFVYILFPPIAHPLATSPNDQEQERNLEFVAETRSRFYKAYVKDE
jgi:superfamily I DNA/RNA helicase